MELKFCLRDWTRRTCKIRNDWCMNHRCPIQIVYVDGHEWEREFQRLRDRGIPEAHVQMHMLRNRATEFIDNLPISTFSLHAQEKDGSLGEWKQSFTDLDKAYEVASNQIADGVPVILIDDFSGEPMVKMS